MDSNTITPIALPRKSHKRIKVQRRPIQTVCSTTTNNDEDPVIVNTKSNYSVIIPPTSRIDATSSKLHKHHHSLTHYHNHIAKERQYIIGNDVILPAWSRQALFIPSNISKSAGPKSVKQYASHAFAHDKAPPYIKKKYKTMQVLESVDEPHSKTSHGTVENHFYKRFEESILQS